MSKHNKVIISCAVTGAIHTPSMSPHLPVTPEEIAESSDRRRQGGRRHHPSACARPGHRPPDQRPEAFTPFLALHPRRMRRGGQPDHRRLALHARAGTHPPALELQPEVASMNMGSMGFGLFPMLKRFKDFKHDWEQPVPGGQQGPGLPQHLSGHRDLAAGTVGQRHALRVRVLRHLPSVQPGPLHRPRADQAALLRADRVRHPRRNRRPSGRRDAHEAHRGPPFRQ